MKQHWLLLKACRRGIAFAVLLTVVLPLGLVLMSTYLSTSLTHGPLGALSLSSIQKFSDSVTPTLFSFSPILALIAGFPAMFCTFLGGPNGTLATLPVPVSNRQWAFLPIAIALGVWTVHIAFLALLMVLGAWLSGPGDIAVALLGIPMMFPIVLLAIVAFNHGIANPSVISIRLYSVFSLFLPMAFSAIYDTTADSGDYMPALAAATLTIASFASAILLWNTPRQRADARCSAVFPLLTSRQPSTMVPFDARQHMARVKSEIRRFHLLSVAIDSVFYILACIGVFGFIAMFVFVMMKSIFPGGRAPLWVEQVFFGSMAVVLPVVLLSFVRNAALIPLQCGQQSVNTRWAQFILGITYHLEKRVTKRGIPKEWIARWNPESGSYVLHFQLADSAEGPETSVPRLLFRDYSQRMSVIPIFFVLLSGFMLVSIDSPVGHMPTGSGVDGDPQMLPAEDFVARPAYAQHYVALDLGANATPEARDEARAAIRRVVAANPSPAGWVRGLRLTDGRAANVPGRYRVELAQPDEHTVVVQGIGLHWDPAGHLAYGLAQRILEHVGEQAAVVIDPDYKYRRPSGMFESAHGFLDNRVHWRAPEYSTGVPDYAILPLPTDMPVYVDARNTGGRQNGKSWATAYDTIQEGINAAYRRRIGGVWVAAGIYDEERRGAGAVYLKSGVHLYGGFNGTETVRTDRDIEANRTVIDGSRSREGAGAWHVIDARDYTTVDGFTITGGTGDGDNGRDTSGGGLIVDGKGVMIANCVFEHNASTDGGGALYFHDGSGTVENCIIRNNQTISKGGAITVFQGEATLRRCTFVGNSATGAGQAFWSEDYPFYAENCLFIDSPDTGAESLIDGKSFILRNCTIIGGGASDPVVLGNDLANATLTNTILWNTSQHVSEIGAYIAYSIVQGGAPGEGNRDTDPLFVDPDNGDYRLRAGSPAIDAGTAKDIPAVDLDGTPRPQGNGNDMGAYEYVPK